MVAQVQLSFEWLHQQMIPSPGPPWRAAEQGGTTVTMRVTWDKHGGRGDRECRISASRQIKQPQSASTRGLLRTAECLPPWIWVQSQMLINTHTGAQHVTRHVPKASGKPPFLSLYQRGTGRFPHPLYDCPSSSLALNIPARSFTPCQLLHCLRCIVCKCSLKMLCKVFFVPVSGLSTSLCSTWALSCYLSDSDKPTAWNPWVTIQDKYDLSWSCRYFPNLALHRCTCSCNRLLTLFGPEMCNFSKNKKAKKHQQKPQNIHKMSSVAFLALVLLLLCGQGGSSTPAPVYFLQWRLHIFYIRDAVFHDTW